MNTTLSRLSTQVIDPLDVSHDRLGHLLTHVSQPTYWQRIEAELKTPSLDVDALPQDEIRGEATTFSGDPGSAPRWLDFFMRFP